MRTLPAVLIGLAMMMLNAGSAGAVEQFSRERDVVDLRLGQRVQVDDGACPQGQIKEIAGAQLSSSGVVRVVRCVPRAGGRR